MTEVALRMTHLSPHFFASLGARIRAMQAEGVDVIRLDEGSPDLPPAPHIIDALARSAARPDVHGYQPHAGPRALRLAWAQTYKRLYQVELNPDEEIVPLLGSKEGIFHLSLAYVEPGDLVLVPNPGYVTYTRGPLFAGGKVFPMPLLPERAYLPDLEAIPLDVLRRAKLMWLNYPHNPTTAVATEVFFEQAVALAREQNLLLCHDAAYTRVTFDGRPAPSVLGVPGAREVSVEFNTLSKSHNMAGWRSAVALGNPGALRTLHTLKTNTDSSHFRPVFEASIAALTGDQGWLEERNQVYRQRRDVIVDALRELGWNPEVPQASMYVWSPLPAGQDCVDFATAALEHARVSLTPGTVFGPGGQGYVRFALTAPLERTVAAMERLKEWMHP